MRQPKVTITIARRPGGGLRVYSKDVQGLCLSHSDAKAVMSDIGPALEVLAPQLFTAEDPAQ